MKTKTNHLRKITILLISVSLITGCGQNAKDFPLTDIESHRNYQEEQANDGGYPQDLIDEYELLLTENFESAEAFYLRGRLEPNNPLKYYNVSLDVNPKFFWSLHGLAVFYSSNDPDKSLSYAKKAIDADNQHYLGYWDAAIAYTYITDKEENLSRKRSYLTKCIDMFKKANEYSGNKFTDDQNKVESYLAEIDETIELQKKTAEVQKCLGHGDQQCIVEIRKNFNGSGKEIIAEEYDGKGEFNVQFIQYGVGVYNAHITTNCECEIEYINITPL